MKDLKNYVKESILDDIDDQIDNTDEVIKNSITRWIKNNVRSIQENKLKFDFSTAPITINYNGDIRFKPNIISLTNGAFQWGEIGKCFECPFCDSLKSLKGAPNKVGGSFYCYKCPSLTSLEGAPEEVGGGFNCFCCHSLTSLVGAPKRVGKSFDCSFCDSLKSLEGAPEKVGGHFSCRYCALLESLEGAPKEIGGDFNCSDSHSLESLEGAPKEVLGKFECYTCKIDFTAEDVKKVSKVKGKILC